MAKKLFLLFLLLAFVCLPSVPAGLAESAKGQLVGDYNPCKKVVVQTPFKNYRDFTPQELPQFLKEWQRETSGDVLKELSRQLDFFNWAEVNYDRNQTGLLNECISFTVKVPERDNYEFTVVLNEYRWDGKNVRYYHKGKMEIVSSEEFEKIKFFLAHKICESADYLAGNLTKGLREKVVAKIEKRLMEYGVLIKEDTLLSELASLKMKGLDVAAEELMFIPPKLDFSTFAPKKVIIAPMAVNTENGVGFILGLCFLDTGIVFYNPLAFVTDIMEFNDTVTHELLHRNPYLQGIILTSYFDPETWTCLCERRGSKWEYLSHPYHATNREAGEIIAAFDADNAWRDIIAFRLKESGSMDMRGNVLADKLAKAEKISSAFRGTMYNEFIQDFYADPLYWCGVNMQLDNANGAWKTFLYSRYAFSLLGGPEKTKEWLDKHRQIIIKAYEEAKGKIEEFKKQQAARNGEDGEEKIMILVGKVYAPYLNMSVASQKQLAADIKMLLKMRVISIPNLKMSPYKMKEVTEHGRN